MHICRSGSVSDTVFFQNLRIGSDASTNNLYIFGADRIPDGDFFFIFGADPIADTNDFKFFGADRTPDTYYFQIFGADRISV